MLQGKKLDLAASQSRLETQESLLWPRLSLEASWRYTTNVAVIPAHIISPFQPEIPFGANNNYSAGPMVSWNFWGTGNAYFNVEAARAQRDAKQDDVNASTRQIQMQARLAYFQVQMALAQLRLITDTLHLSQAQYQYIAAQSRAGQANRIDQLTSHQDTLSNSRSQYQALTDLKSALRDLLSQIGGENGYDLSLPMEAAEATGLPADMPRPTLLLTFDPLDKSLAALAPASQASLDPNLPQIQMFAYLAEASQHLAESLGTGHWPQFLGSAKTSWEYPNGPVLQEYNQNAFGVSMSWSLWEWGRVCHQVDEQNFNAQSNEEQRQQRLTDLTLSWNKAQDQLIQLREIQAINESAVRETETVSRLVYQSYRAGRSFFLDVQNANYRALGASIQSVRTQVQMLIELATLESLAEVAGTGASAPQNGEQK
jgi:outer membrane protein TolC